ncbi:UPF0067 protein yebR, putative [Trichomonas vaginalis G3]|uniref:UPF0067 protein yebR, putative n=1 Tax=Trichomonas vaginalis (strain ATCC PRA-98 / G3) TaxID=412133 RepID=A2DKH2_TRIV3|nr:GAF domain-containing protein [Trichomonas vaginalis G3]EAY19149.1 UPF0067 protein yebR, putative [Trichomonas vaginalis G3]KAI5490447.1 GAF domain-containing protein [Trichomonas vaginalis G3]|eukprot:XP_001580135.1 UPF0067 protein yebR [Trichomonas vaginalis G3]
MTNWKLVQEELKGLIGDDDDRVSVLANTSALINEHMANLNWCGFYMLNSKDILVLGPFQGKTACTRIPIGKGVCGGAVAQAKILRVPDVHKFPGHIACDSASNSEIVLPVYINGKICGVLDIDSPLLDRFSEEDEKGLKECVDILGSHLEKL